jgi:hypothetical protein
VPARQGFQCRGVGDVRRVGAVATGPLEAGARWSTVAWSTRASTPCPRRGGESRRGRVEGEASRGLDALDSRQCALRGSVPRQGALVRSRQGALVRSRQGALVRSRQRALCALGRVLCAAGCSRVQAHSLTLADTRSSVPGLCLCLRASSVLRLSSPGTLDARTHACSSAHARSSTHARTSRPPCD